MEDIGIKDTIRFSVRCAALFINKDKILIHRKRGDRFYTLPGGKCKLGKTPGTLWNGKYRKS